MRSQNKNSEKLQMKNWNVNSDVIFHYSFFEVQLFIAFRFLLFFFAFRLLTCFCSLFDFDFSSQNITISLVVSSFYPHFSLFNILYSDCVLHCTSSIV